MKNSIEGAVRHPVKKGKNHLLFFNIGKFVLDVVKLSFGSLVLGTIIKGDFPQSTVLAVGIIVSVVGAIVGIFLITANDKRKEEK
jgi:hypothetical protein